MNLSLNDIAPTLGVTNMNGDGHTRFGRIHTDTRSIQAGDLFVAIKGESFDANDMLPLALASGAAAAVTHSALPDGLPGFRVADTRVALGALGQFWRKRFTGPLIAVTGSNGKTTATQLIASMLRAHVGNGAHATRNSFNNDVGLPLTLLALTAEHSHAVVEIGMNHPGEIDTLAALALPTVALVNNAQREHQEFMGTVEAVARENACVFAHTAKGGTAVFPANDTFAALWRELAEKAGLTALCFGPGSAFTSQSEWTHDTHGGGYALRMRTPDGELNAMLRMPGLHNVHNALAASACAYAAGLPLAAIADGITNFVAVKGRSHLLALGGAYQKLSLVDDSYNANPDSVRAAIEVLASLPGPRCLILGDMGEVGIQGPEFHNEVGNFAAHRGIDQLLCLGDLAAHAGRAFTKAGGLFTHHAKSIEEMLSTVSDHLPKQGAALVKGSRFMRMERVIAHIQTLSSLPALESTHAA